MADAAAAAVAEAAAANAAGENLKEQMQLNTMDLDSTLRFFKTDSDRDKVTIKASEVKTNEKEMLESLTTLQGYTNDQVPQAARESAATNLVAYYMTKPKAQVRTLDITKAADLTEQATPAFFEPNVNDTVNIRTVDQMLGGATGKFRTFNFTSEYQKDLTYNSLLQYCYRKASKTVPPAAKDRDTKVEDRAALLTAIEDAMDGINLTHSLFKYEQSIRSQTKSDIVRTQTIGSNLADELVSPPLYGRETQISETTLKHINTSMNLTPFGSAHSTKELSSYLSDLKNLVNGRYTEKTTYSLLLKILTGEPRETVKNHERLGTSLAHVWLYLQTTYGQPRTSQDLLNKIKTLIHTRPQNTQAAMASIENAIVQKNRSVPISERAIVNKSEITASLFTFLTIWHPASVHACRRTFDQIMNQAAVEGKDPMPPGVLINLIVTDQIKVPAVSQKTAQINAMESVSVSELTFDSLLTETNKTLASMETKPSTDKQNTSETSINAMNTPKYTQNQTGARPKRRRMPQYIMGRCWKCTSKLHLSPACPSYPNDKLAQTPCQQCKGFHTSPCRGATHPSQYLMESSEDRLALEDHSQQ